MKHNKIINVKNIICNFNLSERQVVREEWVTEVMVLQSVCKDQSQVIKVNVEILDHLLLMIYTEQ